MSLHRQNIIAETVSVALLREAISYDAATGNFVWRERPVAHFPDGKLRPERRAAMWNGKYAGRAALTCKDPRGYRKGMLNQKMVWAHRVALALHLGEWPKGEVDHINRDKTDNRLGNLRVVTHQENAMNRDNDRQKRRSSL